MDIRVTFAEGLDTLADYHLELGCYGEVNSLVRTACDQFHAQHPGRSLLDGVTITLQRDEGYDRRRSAEDQSWDEHQDAAR